MRGVVTSNLQLIGHFPLAAPASQKVAFLGHALILAANPLLSWCLCWEQFSLCEQQLPLPTTETPERDTAESAGTLPHRQWHCQEFRGTGRQSLACIQCDAT